MYTIKCVLQKSRVSKTNIYPIYMRLTISRRHAYINTGIRIDEAFWDKRNAKIKSSYPNSKAMNLSLTRSYGKIEKACIKRISKNKILTAKRIKNSLKKTKSDSECFFAYADKWIDTRSKTNIIKVGTKARYEAVIAKLKDYTNSKLLIKEFKFSFMQDYQIHLLDKVGNSQNTINSNFKVIKTIVRDMVKDGKMKSKNNPFDRYLFKNTPTKRKHLTIEDMGKIARLMLPVGSKQEESRDIFMFCYYNGFRISDSLNLKLSNIQGGFLMLESLKNNININHPITPNAQTLIDKYSKGKQSTDYLFSFLKPASITDDESLMLSIKRSTALIKESKDIQYKM